MTRAMRSRLIAACCSIDAAIGVGCKQRAHDRIEVFFDVRHEHQIGAGIERFDRACPMPDLLPVIAPMLKSSVTSKPVVRPRSRIISRITGFE